MSKGRIKATFVLDALGKPKGRTSGNYEIVLAVDGAGQDVYGVTYELDPSYYDPVRDVRASDNEFAEVITSYGDYVIKATLRTTSGVTSLRRRLYEALLETHGMSVDPDVQQALIDIMNN